LFDSIQDHIRRSVAPSCVVALSRIRAKQTLASTGARLLGQTLRMDLYFAFDDAGAAIAVPGVLQIANHQSVDLRLYPIVNRGIANDPAAAARLTHSIKDAQLLAARTGQRLMRTGPVLAEACAFLANWTEAMRGHPAVNTFAAAAVREIWFRSSGEIPYEACARLYRETFGQDRPTDNPQLIEAVQDNSRRLIRKGHWESPVVDIHGEWFFAHERLGEIASRLQQLSAS
jgi:2-hydroxychromene-2-carboxylate isomerase